MEERINCDSMNIKEFLKKWCSPSGDYELGEFNNDLSKLEVVKMIEELKEPLNVFCL